MTSEMRLGATLAAIVSGDGTAVVGPTLVALVDAPPSDPLVEAIWAVAEAEGPFDEALAALASVGSDGFAGLSDLILFGWEDDGCRLVIRGEVGAEINGRDGMQQEALQGGGVRSWAEHVYAEVGSVRAWVGEVRVATPEFLGYAIDRGIAPARGVDVLAPGTDVARPVARSRRSKQRPVPVEVPPEVAAALAASGVDAPSDASPLLPTPSVDEELVASGTTPDTDIVSTVEGAAPSTGADGLADVGDERLTGADDPGDPLASGVAEAGAAGSPPSLDTIHPGALHDGSFVEHDPKPEDDGPNDFDVLFGATQFRSVEGAAIRADEAVPDAPAPDAPAPRSDLGPDHDGMTVTAAELRSMIGSAPSAGGAPSGGSGHLATRCAQGHLNPPHGSVCRACGQSIQGQSAVRVPQLDIGVFRFTDGTRIPVTKPMLIGRSPKMSGPISGVVPDLVTVASPAQDISRTHVEVRVEGWQVMVLDKGSTNGTTVMLPGRDPQRLRPDHPFPLPIGGRVNLADEAEFTFEVGP